MIDIKRFAPESYLQSDRFMEFMEVVNASFQEVYTYIEGEDSLYEVETIGKFLHLLLKNFGFTPPPVLDETISKFIAKEIMHLFEIKSTNLFLQNLASLYNMLLLFEDLSKYVVVPSYQQVLSGGYLQDALYYRDGAVVVTTRHAGDVKDYIMKYISAGTYVWFVALFEGIFTQIEISGKAQSSKGITSPIKVDIFSECFLSKDYELTTQVACYGGASVRDSYSLLTDRFIAG